ncbi:MAG: alkaline phosphatase family protein [Flavobacteriales bacterium]|nr:alkaline phosphatase family protein [Flavobacteriales bacterium]
MIKPLLSLLLLFSSFQQELLSQTKKLLFIGIDGCRNEAIDVAVCPTLDMLISQGVHSKECLTLYPTWSGNGWSTMLTGVKHNKHLVTDNSFSTTNFNEFPDFLTRIENYNSALQTYSVVHWGPINSTINQNPDYEITVATDLEVKNEGVSILQNENPDVLFIAFDDVDHAGHQYGFDISIPEYLSSIETTDGYIEEILAALSSRPNYNSEDWLIMVTTDHGGNLSGHGLGSLEERTSFITCYNQNIPAVEISAPLISTNITTSTAHFEEGEYAQPDDQTPFAFGSSQDFTIEFWVKTDVGFSADPSFISNKDWNSGMNPGFVISGQSGQFWKVNIGDGSARADIQGGHINANWTHLAVSFDRDGYMKAYENGALVGLSDISGIGNIDSGLPLVINQDGTMNYGVNFDGYFRDIRVWNEVIEQEVLTQWATTPLNSGHPNFSSLTANWPCSTENNLTLTDTGPASVHATLNATLDWTSQQEIFAVKDYANTPKEEDNAVTAISWFCIPIDPLWNLDGKSLLENCESSIHETEFSSLTLSPNPTNGIVRLHTMRSVEQIAVIDVTGRLCKTLYNTKILDLSDLADGLYFIQAYSENQVMMGQCQLNK